MFATVCLLDPLSVKLLILTVRLHARLTTGCLGQKTSFVGSQVLHYFFQRVHSLSQFFFLQSG